MWGRGKWWRVKRGRSQRGNPEPRTGCIRTNTDVIAPPPGELFSETNDNSVAILLTYGTARVLLAGDAEAREGGTGERFVHEALNGHQRPETTHNLSQGSALCWPEKCSSWSLQRSEGWTSLRCA
jgi:hypothetical protein